LPEDSSQPEARAENLPGRNARPASQPPRPQPSPSKVHSAPSASSAVPSQAQASRQRTDPRSDDARLKRQEQIKRRAQAAKLLQRTWRGHVVRRNRVQLEASIVPLQSLIRGYLLRMKHAERILDALETKDHPPEDEEDEDAEQYEDAEEDLHPEMDGDDLSSRDQFYDDLQVYLEVSGAEIERQPIIDGRQVELWDLFSVVTQQDCAVEDRDWKKVARRLGFDWTGLSRCAEDLREYYNHNLADFEEAIGSYDNQDDTARDESEPVPHDDEDQMLPATSDAVTAPKDPSPAPLSPPNRSSSSAAGLKRSFQQSNDPQSELGYPSDGPSKRQRRDRGKAIPPTPEHQLRSTGGSSSRALTQDFSSPVKPRGAAAVPSGVYSAEDAEDFLDNGINDIQGTDDLPALAPPKKKPFLEPETQDFGFVMGNDNDVRPSIESSDIGHMTDEDEDDNTPSQQLQSEFDAISSPARPIPNRANVTAAPKRPPFVEPRPRSLRGPAEKTHTSVSATPATNGPARAAAYHSIPSLNATKRLLPQQYQKQPAAQSPKPNGIAAPQLQSRSPVVARPATVNPADKPASIDSVVRRPGQPVLSTPTRAVRSSARASAPVPNPVRGRDKAHIPDFGEEYVDAQFEHFRALGYEDVHIGRALEAASFQRGPMTVALQSLHSGKGIPRDAPGVWTDDDDEKLRKVRDYNRRKGAKDSGKDSREEARVEVYREFLLRKHNVWVDYRLAFMDMMDKGLDA
ncbi:hypothetical protein diail_2691, partial [Diaporthe ilicicola]